MSGWQVWIDRGAGLERADVGFADDEAVRRLAVRLAGAAGRRLDDAVPWVDAGLPDGTRLHAVLPPVSGSGTCLSLRVLRRCSRSVNYPPRSSGVQPTRRRDDAFSSQERMRADLLAVMSRSTSP